jgi:hypothetical protein
MSNLDEPGHAVICIALSSVSILGGLTVESDEISNSSEVAETVSLISLSVLVNKDSLAAGVGQADKVGGPIGDEKLIAVVLTFEPHRIHNDMAVIRIRPTAGGNVATGSARVSTNIDSSFGGLAGAQSSLVAFGGTGTSELGERNILVRAHEGLINNGLAGAAEVAVALNQRVGLDEESSSCKNETEDLHHDGKLVETLLLERRARELRI